MKNTNDHEKKLVFCNYGEQFETIFKFENPLHE
jgi:hypothetical protein